MKIQATVIAVISAFLMASTDASAAATSTRNQNSRQSIRVSQAAPVAASSSSSTKWGLGLSASRWLTNTPTFSALIQIDDKSAVQTYVGIGSTSPFTFGLGGTYKYTVAGGREAGFHVGGGLGLGTMAGGTGSLFFINFAGIGGVHFTVARDVVLSFDGGLGLVIVDGTAGFGIRPISDETLGLSVHYML